MVRNKKVDHPSEWAHAGYHEIQHPPKRYSLLNREKLKELCGLESDEHLRMEHRRWVEEAIVKEDFSRQPEWTESIAVGSRPFVDGIKEKLISRGLGRKVQKADDYYELREQEAAYNVPFTHENDLLSLENTYLFNLTN